MTYLAIARKYRPVTFDEIVGQEHVTRTLRNAITNERIHHAYLFTGARGVGKTTAARALARALNCVEGPTADPCGVCTSCTEVAAGSSPDLIEIDGASNNSVDDVREIREAVQYAPTSGRWKIYLVDEVHMLSKGAFNALLKTLEEPPPHVVFIFATTEPNKIPDTILSRVQRFDFKRIPVPKVVEHLAGIAAKEGVEIGTQGLRLIAQAGEGSMRDAQSLLDQVIAYGGHQITDAQVTETLGLIDRALLHEFIGGLVQGDAAACLAAIERVYGYGYELAVFTEELLEILRHATFLRLSPEARRFVDLADDEVETLAAIVEPASPERLGRLFTAMLEVHDQVSRASRPRIVLDMAVARLATTREAQPVAALVERLYGLERSLRMSGASPGRGGSSRAPAPPAPAPRAPRGTQRGSTRGGGGGPSSREPSPGSSTPPRGPVAQSSQDEPPPLTHDPGVPDDGWGSPDPAPPPPPMARASRQPSEARASTPQPRPRKPSARRAPAASPESPTLEADPRWTAFADALEGAAHTLAKATPVLQGTRLRLVFRAGRALAEARRAADHPSVAAALAASYPAGTELSLEAKRGGRVDSAQLEREFLADPALARIVKTLGATIERVEAPPEPNDAPDGAT